MLVVGRSLLWSVIPLRNVPEGGVNLFGGSPNDVSRLSAQLTILDPIHRPVLMSDSVESLENLPIGFQFEWVGGRLHSQDLITTKINQTWESITKKCTSNAG